jgi:membrane protease YdiL (CAAX protease family)
MNQTNRAQWIPREEDAAEQRPLFGFFVLVFALSVPLWAIGALCRFQLAEGLPVSSLMTFCPLLAALVLLHTEKNGEAARGLLRRILDYRRIEAKAWYAPVILLMPGVVVLAYGLKSLPFPSLQAPIPGVPLLFLGFLVAAAGEEVGWTGYAIHRMQFRLGALQASVLLGLVWAAWHVIPFVQAGRPPAWIAWQCLCLIASRVLITWIYNNTGKSLFAAILFHAFINVASVLFPEMGLPYDPRLTSLIAAGAAAAVAIVWGPHTLAGPDRGLRSGRSPRG